MKKIIVILVVLLLATNCFWFYKTLDQSVANSYLDQQVYELEKTNKQLMSMIPDITKDLDKENIINIASKYAENETYEKNDCIWVGWLGLKFDSNEKLLEVAHTWSYSNEDPCMKNF